MTSVVSFSLSLWEPWVKFTQIPTHKDCTKYFCKAKILCLVETKKMSRWRKHSQLWIPKVDVVKVKRWSMWLWPNRERTWFHTSCCAEIHIPLKGFGTFSSYICDFWRSGYVFRCSRTAAKKRKKAVPATCRYSRDSLDMPGLFRLFIKRFFLRGVWCLIRPPSEVSCSYSETSCGCCWGRRPALPLLQVRSSVQELLVQPQSRACPHLCAVQSEGQDHKSVLKHEREQETRSERAARNMSVLRCKCI